MHKFWITAHVFAFCLLCSLIVLPANEPPLMRAPFPPVQTAFTTPQPVFAKNGWTLTPLATFFLDAVVLGVKAYPADFSATLAPCDLALGWGQMSDASVSEKIVVTQENRFYYWRYWGTAPVPENEIITQSANMHIIPATLSIAETLSMLHRGHVVHLEGVLVNAFHPKADKLWKTSLTREDFGPGACEIFYVTTMVVDPDLPSMDVPSAASDRRDSLSLCLYGRAISCESGSRVIAARRR